MREHILSRTSEYIPHISSEKTHYDFRSQVNYSEENFQNKLTHNHSCKGPTAVTETVEPSDLDNIINISSLQHSLKGPTHLTFTVEQTDTDR